MYQFMRVGIADLSKEKSSSDENANFRDDTTISVCERVNHQRK
jgi:hypothetical protein